ncbi:MAG: GNAT family N-acetyltransferase [Pseudomonadales bacterium]|nr:GNAT family N-acetyltransferase [Pseudomonadales bacterium]
MKHKALQIGTAHPDDYDALLTMNTAAVPAVNRIDRNLLEKLHRQAEVLLVARESAAPGSPAGFLLALNEQADYGSPNFLYFRDRYPSFAYVDRVVVDPRVRGQGIGKRLYQALIEHRRNQGLITCEVNVEPPNPGSLSFHQRMGFRAVDEQATEGGNKRVALMVLTLPGGPRRHSVDAYLPDSDPS